MTWREVSLVFSLPLDAATVPGPYRRFADDVALALTGDKQPTVAALRWPMVKSAQIDQSKTAAGIVVKQRVERCAPAVVVFGKDTQEWIGDLSPRRCLVVDEIDTFVERPLGKRALWHDLLVFRAGLNDE